jgi:hypothetical protein
MTVLTPISCCFIPLSARSLTSAHACTHTHTHTHRESPNATARPSNSVHSAKQLHTPRPNPVWCRRNTHHNPTNFRNFFRCSRQLSYDFAYLQTKQRSYQIIYQKHKSQTAQLIPSGCHSQSIQSRPVYWLLSAIRGSMPPNPQGDTVFPCPNKLPTIQ